MARDHRRLAAIVISDVVGFSRHMERDDAGTLARLREIREHLIDPKIVEYGGHVVKTAGDGMLLEFGSADAALRCAIDMQRAMAARNQAQAADERIEFRIGINLGDIIIDGNDIAGDGVNVAARLEALAEPGGICVSSSVREQVHGNVDVGFDDIGEQQVKNIARPIRVFRVALGNEASRVGGRKRWQRLTRSFGWRWLAAGFLALGLAGIAVWTLPQFWKTAAPASTLQPFSIVVLPFVAPAGNPADEQFAEALTNDLTMAIGRGRLTHVVSHSLAVIYKGKEIDARAIGRDLNVRYLVQGEVRRTGDQLTVNAQLVDAGNAAQLWSDQLEVDPAQTAQASRGLVALLTGRVRGALIGAELRRASEPVPPGVSAEDLWLHAYAMIQKDSSTVAADSVMAMLEARRMLDQALRLDPNLVVAINLRAHTLSAQLELDLHADHDRIVQELDEMSNRAISVEPNDSVAWVYRTEALASQWRWQAALEANSKSSSLDPLRLAPLTERARIMLYMGQPTEALTLIDKALAQDPQDNAYVASALLQRCRAYQALGRYEDAIAACEKSVAQSDWWLGHAYLVAAYAQKGETAKAAAEKIILLKEQPAMTIADLKAQRLSNDPGYLQQTEAHLYAGLHKAGIPEK